MSRDDLEDDLLTEAEYSRKTGWSIATLRSWRARGMGPPYIKLHRKVSYRWSSHTAYVLAHERDPALERTNRTLSAEPAVSTP